MWGELSGLRVGGVAIGPLIVGVHVSARADVQDTIRIGSRFFAGMPTLWNLRERKIAILHKQASYLKELSRSASEAASMATPSCCGDGIHHQPGLGA